MTAREEGFLLLTSHLGDLDRRPLTVAQFRDLARNARIMERPAQDRELEAGDLTRIGCDSRMAERILMLLSQTEQLRWYVQRGKKSGCVPVTRISADYPASLRKSLGEDSPGVLWAKGDPSLLEQKKIALVGSRTLAPENRAFAREAGRQAALQGYVLVSGNARGADREAQDSCLAHGGRVISVVADSLEDKQPREKVLYLSEDAFDSDFSAWRALSRNRVIHCLGQAVLVAQCTCGKGGTWDGTVKNLRYRWSPVHMLNDGSPAFRELTQMGAAPVTGADLLELEILCKQDRGFF